MFPFVITDLEKVLSFGDVLDDNRHSQYMEIHILNKVIITQATLVKNQCCKTDE